MREFLGHLLVGMASVAVVLAVGKFVGTVAGGIVGVDASKDDGATVCMVGVALVAIAIVVGLSVSLVGAGVMELVAKVRR